MGTIADRLRWAIERFFDGRINQFSEVCGIAPQQLQRYLNSKSNEKKPSTPSIETLERIEANAGISKVWLGFGIGLVVADNEAGDKLVQKYTENKYGDLQRHRRTWSFIQKHYNGLRNYGKIFKIDPIAYERIFTGEDIYVQGEDFVKKLEESGLNIEWVKTGEGEPFKPTDTINENIPVYNISNHKDVNNDLNNVMNDKVSAVVIINKLNESISAAKKLIESLSSKI